MGWHYASNSTKPINTSSATSINNVGLRDQAAELMRQNKINIQDEVYYWMDQQATAAQARMNNNYETGPVPKNIFTAPKASTGYKTKDVNNSFAARRDIRNIFA